MESFTVRQLLTRLERIAPKATKRQLVETVLDLEEPTPSGEGTRGRGNRN